MEIWDKLDEVIGAGLLTAIAIYGMRLGTPDIANGCVAGIIALLVAKAIVKKNGGDK